MKKNKKIIIGISIFVVLVGVFVIAYFSLSNINRINKSANICNYTKEITVLNKNYPSDIIVYGDEVGFDSSLNFRTIDSLTEENLNSEEKYKYKFLVINDSSGSLKISDDEFELCKKMCDENDISFFYIGEQYLEYISKFGFHDGIYNSNSRGIGYVYNSIVGHMGLEGIWTTEEIEYLKSDKMLLGQLLCYAFVDNVIKMNEK